MIRLLISLDFVILGAIYLEFSIALITLECIASPLASCKEHLGILLSKPYFIAELDYYLYYNSLLACNLEILLIL